MPGNPLPSFPDQRFVIADDARRFRRLTPRQRWQQIFALRAWGDRLSGPSPRGDAIRKLDMEAEEAWQAIQRELFARHGR